MRWPSLAIGDIAEVVTKGTTPTTLGRPFVDHGVNFVKAEALNGDAGLDQHGFAFIDEGTHQLLQRSILQEDDVLVTIAGAKIGKCGYAKPEILPANTNQAVGIIRVNKLMAVPRFVYYFFKQPATYSLVQSMGAQAAQPNLNLSSLKKIRIPLPTVTEQQKIADALFAFDDLIENNRRRIELLEQAARLLYKEWFVNFRFPGHEHVKIKNGVPAGWENGTVSDFFDTTSGGTPSRKRPEFFSGDINWVKTQELNEDFIFETEEKITPEALTKSSAKLFPADTLLVSIYGGTNIGRTGILAKPAASNQACVALFPRHPSSNFIFAQLFLQTIRNSLIGIAQGAAQTNISQQTFRKIAMVMPPSALMRSFLDSLTPVYVQLKNLKLQNMNFEKARDLLLPRLMNGDVSV